MARELPKTYEPQKFQERATERWLQKKAFAAVPDDRPWDRRYVVMMPLPNVTGALHMGHAMDNMMQDLLVRWHRMKGDNTLWQPGTDHAGIATQAVVEKRLFEFEGKTRQDIGREALVERIWQWKDEYQRRIVDQQQQMGCSADWDRQRFTMDPVCSAAVRETFFSLFRDGLIYRGNRLVNWDCQLQTAVADDEVYHDTMAGHFWHLKYPVIDPKPGEPSHVIVATTRPETMLGDTAVACHPDPAAALDATIAEQEAKVAAAPAREKESATEELERLKARRQTHLDQLQQLVEMARDGRQVMLPLMERPIPLILDVWAKPELGSGCVKITPGHDPNDYEVWERHADEIGVINILNPDGTLNDAAGAYRGADRLEARKQVVSDLESQGLLHAIEDREIDIGHSDRSKTPIEPYLSRQWFVRMGDIEGGIEMAGGTANTFRAAGLAQAAIDAVDPSWSSPGGRRLEFHPERYTGQYVSWLAEKRDWCISRQLWWGHRIPVWSRECADGAAVREALEQLGSIDTENMWLWVSAPDGSQHNAEELESAAELAELEGPFDIQICLRGPKAEEAHAERLTARGFVQDPDVLDTWFSSALWPFSTLGWPDPAGAAIDAGQTSLGAGAEDSFRYYYPGSCLVTGRDIITLWVARMVIMGLYIHGDVPFTDSFIHAKILDGKGVTMSKSKGNGIDPVDIIERYGADAMRYLICDMETGMQDVRLPVQAECPSCNETVELASAEHGRTIFTYTCTACGKEFDVLGTIEEVPNATVTSDRFEVGRSFCNKLWNATRFALMNLGEHVPYQPLKLPELPAEDRWMLSRLDAAVEEVTRQLEAYLPSAALGAARGFFWNEFCDWYLELIKPRMRDEATAPVARQVLAAGLDQVLRLFHPFVPFITEGLWESLQGQAPVRGIDSELPAAELCIHAAWPAGDSAWRDAALEAELQQVQEVITRLRELRSRYNVPPSKQLPAAIQSQEALDVLERHHGIIEDMARLSSLELGASVDTPANAATNVVGPFEVFLGDVLDPEKERKRLNDRKAKLIKQIESIGKKLQNEGFVAKAPAAVVENERKRLADFEGQLALVQKSLDELGG